MAELFRPEARAALWRWREAIAAGVVAALGLRWALGSFGILQWLGWALVALAAVFGYAAVQRLRFRPGTGGPGTIQIDERRLTYFGPLTGGDITLDELIRIELIGAAHPPHWRLRARDGAVLDVPLNADGAEALFDGFAALPGMRVERLIAATRDTSNVTRIVWQRPEAAPTQIG